MILGRSRSSVPMTHTRSPPTSSSPRAVEPESGLIRRKQELKDQRRNIEIALEGTEVMACALIGDRAELLERRRLLALENAVQFARLVLHRLLVYAKHAAERQPVVGAGRPYERDLRLETPLLEDGFEPFRDELLHIVFVGDDRGERVTVIAGVLPGPVKHVPDRDPLLGRGRRNLQPDDDIRSATRNGAGFTVSPLSP